MSDPTPLTCILLLLIMGAAWFVLVQARNTARKAPIQTLTLSTELSREQITRKVQGALPRSIVSSAFNWSVDAKGDELRATGYYLTNGMGCTVLLFTGILPGFLLLLLTRDRTEAITIDFSSLEDTGSLEMTLSGSRAQKIMEKLFPELESYVDQFRWDEAVLAATATAGLMTEQLPGNDPGKRQADGDPQPVLDSGESVENHLERAYDHLDENHFEKALQACQRAIQSDPDSAEAHNLRGVILDSAGRRTEAIAAYEQALKLDPSYTDARSNLDELLRENEEELRLIRSPESRRAFAAFCRASSQETMNQIVGQHPVMLTTYFQQAIDEVLSGQVSEDDRPLFQRRQTWLATAVEKERARAAGR